MIKVENKRTYKGHGEYIGRPSALGNPFAIGKDGTRAEVIEKYRHWLWNQLKKVEITPAKKEFLRLAAKAQREDLVLICWCAPLACHGDVIKRAIEWVNRSR